MPIWKRNLFICWFGAFATMAGLSQITPILPLFITELGVRDIHEVEKWSGLAFGITFIISAIASPIWGHAADRFGRKPMLLRASLGMAITITMMGFAENVFQLVGLRLLMGAVAGFVSAAITLVATQTPLEHAGWALGTLSTGSVGGMLLGPLVGGYIAETIGLRSVFFVTGALLVVAFLTSLFFIQEKFAPPTKKLPTFREIWATVPDTNALAAMFVTTFILQLALISIQPIITVYIHYLVPANEHIAILSGMVIAVAGLASILAAPNLGRLSDRIGAEKVVLVALIAAGIIFIPQAFVRTVWQFMGLQFLLGIANAGLLPSVNSLVKRYTPTAVAGRVFGYNQSAQFLGSFGGAVLGGQIAATYGIHYVFFFTSTLLLINAIWVYQTVYKAGARKGNKDECHREDTVNN